MIELYIGKQFKNNVFFKNTSNNTRSTITGYGVRTLFKSLKSGDYVWFPMTSHPIDMGEYDLISTGSTMEMALYNLYPEALI